MTIPAKVVNFKKNRQTRERKLNWSNNLPCKDREYQIASTQDYNRGAELPVSIVFDFVTGYNGYSNSTDIVPHG